MPVDKCIAEYEKLGKMVFGEPRLPVINKVKPKFDHNNLEKAIHEVCSRHSEALGLSNWEKLNYVTSLKTYERDMLCRWYVTFSFIDKRDVSGFNFKASHTLPSTNRV